LKETPHQPQSGYVKGELSKECGNMSRLQNYFSIAEGKKKPVSVQGPVSLETRPIEGPSKGGEKKEKPGGGSLLDLDRGRKVAGGSVVQVPRGTPRRDLILSK